MTTIRMQHQGPLVFSSSSDGGVSVWERRSGGEREPLRLLCHWSGQVTGCTGALALSPRGNKVLLADGQPWIKILDWTTGALSRLTNHGSVTGVTDCVHQTGGLLIGSRYDAADGDSGLDLFSLPRCRYLASLRWPRASRMLCFASWTTRSGAHRWVSGGRDLIVWEQLPITGKRRSDITVKREVCLELPPESEGDMEDDETDEHLEDDEDDAGRDEDDVAPAGSWLRCVLQ